MIETPAYDSTVRTDAARIERSLADSIPRVFWLDGADRPAALPGIDGRVETDLLVVGGGYCGLWTALMAKESHPNRDVVLVEGKRIGWAASGRNGGFAEASLTHGPDNGERYFSSELEALERLGRENLDELEASLIRHGIDAEFERSGELMIATEPHQIDWLREQASDTATFYDAESLPVKSPLFRAGLLETADVAMVNPAKLVFGLREACLRLGVRIFENSPVKRIANEGSTVRATLVAGSIRARQVALATNGFPSLLMRNRLLTVPIYDYVLMTEPLTDTQLADIGWVDRFGMNDSSRQFHYYRKTADNRILWGGYDAVYHRGGAIRSEYDENPETFRRLADHFLRTFPQLGDVRFTHRWGGMIDMSTRLVAFQGAAMGGKVAYSSGFTGLGVAATRYGASVMLDLLAGRDTERTRMSMVTKRPLPIPPEPIAYPAVQIIRRSVAKSDRNGGKDDIILRAANALGFSFDS